MQYPRFITFEGPDGAGKTTQIEAAVRMLSEWGHDLVRTREPGGTALCEKIRDLVLDPAHQGMADEAELFLYAASRAEHVKQVILPALSAGKTVICDRYADSTYAYQGHGRQMGPALTDQVNAIATLGVMPALTFVVMVEPKTAMERMRNKDLDRMEREDEGFRLRVYEGFLELAQTQGDRVCLLDGSQPPDVISRAIEARLMQQYAPGNI